MVVWSDASSFSVFIQMRFLCSIVWGIVLREVFKVAMKRRERKPGKPIANNVSTHWNAHTNIVWYLAYIHPLERVCMCVF